MPTLGKFPMPPPVPLFQAGRRQPAKKRVGPSFLLRYFLMIIIAKNGGYFTCRSLSASLSVFQSPTRCFCQFSVRWRRFRTWRGMGRRLKKGSYANCIILAGIISMFQCANCRSWSSGRYSFHQNVNNGTK